MNSVGAHPPVEISRRHEQAIGIVIGMLLAEFGYRNGPKELEPLGRRIVTTIVQFDAPRDPRDEA